MKAEAGFALVLLLAGHVATAAAAAAAWDPSQVWPAYRKQQAAYPVDYDRLEVSSFEGGERRTYQLRSQRWPEPAGDAWLHRVEVLVPQAPQAGPALLVINNGVAHEGGGRPVAPASDFPPEVLERLVRTLGMAVVSIADVPPQAMTLPGDARARTEDDLVAASWRRFLDAPSTHGQWPLHVPMAEAAIRAMDLADRELPEGQRPSYVVTGASKRGWASWLLPLVDDRVSHLAPFVIDMNWQGFAPQIRRAYGERWPIALSPYVEHGVTGEIEGPAFTQLMQIVDPYTYLHGPLRQRLALPKLLVNASGDDFFVPDGAGYYLAELPGPTALRVAPNSDHGGIRRFTVDTLEPALKRWRAGRALPELTSKWLPHVSAFELNVKGPERPQRALLWQAHNPIDRDFRKACGIDYHASEVALEGRRRQSIPVNSTAQGWTASFVELHFADGLVLTTPVQVTPEDAFPVQPPAEGEGRCRLAPEPAVSGLPAAQAR
ncbi:PhoPQ-activated protein PqaA family protein [Stenotrophomonas sp. RAC2]|uniref:PhoPQ-activated protein PqaA family protein n=1 Tax=Stenotrophomonas sp. RAC2 TaxID=3064902 RepID=UPI001311A6AA|nr:PhoPQ-activated protein PqaA family protein [Stenotrophomonas sp. RAC2]MDV9043049.1 PhoPQ-activated protein PqaA family protein [Stenotrophomonas sp. RAC2]